MSDENKSCSVSENAEPAVQHSGAPMWIIVATLVLFFVCGYYFDQHSGWFDAKVYAPYSSTDQLEAGQPVSGPAAVLARGKKNYESICGVCHSPDGLGKPGQAPALAGSEWVLTKGDSRLAHIPLAGLSGPLQVEGKDWNLSMAAMGAALSDDNLAGVLTYIRSSWGNNAGPVTSDDVKKARADVAKSPQALTGEKLKALPE